MSLVSRSTRRSPLRMAVMLAMTTILIADVSAAPPANAIGPDPSLPATTALRTDPALDAGIGGLLPVEDPTPAVTEGASLSPSIFDDFNRTVANPGWGYATSGAPWQTYIADYCTGYTAGVDGQHGTIAGSPGATCLAWPGELTNPSSPSQRFWDAPSWSFTAKFKFSKLAGDLELGVATQLNQVLFAGIEADPVDSRVALRTYGYGDPSTTFAWQPDTWYSMKLVVAWADQMRVKVWPSSEPEPVAWLLGISGGPGWRSSSPLIVRFNDVDGTTLYVDDFSSGPAPILPKLPPPPDTQFNPPYDNQEDAGDPVSTLTGALSLTNVDTAIPGRGPAIDFARSYNSNDTRVTPLGPGWTHSYNIRLTDPGDGSQDVILVGPQGRSDRYTWTGSGFTPPIGNHTTLARNGDDTYTATLKSLTTWQFDGTGRLTAIRDRYGDTSSLSYDSSGRLATIGDPAGRGSLTLGYTNGLLTSVNDWASPARTVAYQYDADGRLWKATDREGKTMTYAYDGTSARIATITDARANTALSVTYDAQGRVATQQDARGLLTGDVTTFDYVVNPDGTRVTTTTLPVTSFEPAFHPSLVDSYDANGWLASRVTHPSSTETLTQTFSYDAAGNRTSVTEPSGVRIDFCYDVDYAGNPIPGGAANLTRRIDPAPAGGANRPVALLAYDASNNVVQTVSPKGVPSGPTVSCSTDLSAVTSTYATELGYDAAGINLLSITNGYTDPDTGPQPAITKYEYGDAANPGLVTRVIPPRGNTGPNPDYAYATTFTYYASGLQAGQLQDVTDPLGNKSSFAYDPVGRLVSSVDPLGTAAGGVPAEHTTTFSYDREDRLRFETLPAPAPGGSPLVTETRYDELGHPTIRIDARGQVTTYGHDERGTLSEVRESADSWTDPASPPASVITTRYAHDAGGNTTRITRAAGDGTYERASDYAYDGRGLQRTETEYPAWPSTAGALVTSRSYDPNGNLLTASNPLGRTTTYGYDALDELSSIDYADASTPDVAYGYDANGNRTLMTDGTGSTSYAYDEADWLVSVRSPGPTIVGYRYDLDGNRTKLIYPDGTAVTYTFDEAGRLGSLADWASRSVAYTYWPDGLPKTAANPDGSVSTYTYDNARRLIDILDVRSGTTIERFTYGLDPAGNVTSVANGPFDAQYARPDGLASSNGTWTGTYVSINEVTPNDAAYLASPTSPTTSNYYEVTLSDIVRPGTLTGITVRYRYAKSGNNSGKTINLTVEFRQGSTVIASVTHTNIPGATGSGWQQGTITLTSAQAASITNFADLRIRFRPSSSGGGQGRAAQISWAEVQSPGPGDPATQYTYGYDRLSRLTSVSGPDGARSYTYDPVGNRLSKTSGGTTTYTYDGADRLLTAGSATITVDAAGNLVARGADTFGYDAANRLVGATVSGSAETYAYDGDGVRVSRQVGANPPTRYVSDVNTSLPITLDDGTHKYVYGLGLAYAVTAGGLEVYHADRLGSVRALTDGSGTVTATYRTDEWGVPVASTSSSTQPYGFTGEPTDATGLVYLRSRSYDPAIGRFLSRDGWPGSQSVPQSENRYVYVAGNPLTRTDPSGACAVDTIFDVGFIAYDLVSLVFGPPKEQGDNLTALGADVGGALLPCATGLGIAVRGGIKWVQSAGRNIRFFNPDTILAENKLKHLFKAEHNLDRLGSQTEAIDEIVKAVFAADAQGRIPASGTFEITEVIDGVSTTIRGAIVNGELRIGTAFIR